MLSKNDCMNLLLELEDKGKEVNSYIRRLMLSKDVPLEVLKFIVENQGMNAANFYEVLRQKHNKSKSQLYVNLVNEELDDSEVLIVLSSLLTQIFLYKNKNENISDIFFNEVRLNEILQALENFRQTGNLDLCKKLLRLVRSDLLVLEYISGRRELF